MKDLFVLTADADAQAVLSAVLQRHEQLGIRPIAFDIDRFPGRDPGMVREGPEIVRSKVNKADYAFLLLIWDHHGSGKDRREPQAVQNEIRTRLEGVTWKGRSEAVIAVPELEEWLWCCERGLARSLELGPDEFRRLADLSASKLGLPLSQCSGAKPKELFESLFLRRMKRKPLPADFRRIGSFANLSNWSSRSSSFSVLTSALRSWFPLDMAGDGPSQSAER